MQDFVKTRSSAQVDHEAECKELATAVADRGKAKNAKKQATLDTEIERVRL